MSLAHQIAPLISGGTGSISDSEEQPDFLPDKFESGTPNIPGIFGLHAGLKYVTEKREEIHAHEMELTALFLEELKAVDGVRIVGPKDLANRAPVVSLDFIGRDNAETAFILESEYGIATRCGLHCAPNAHKTLETYPQGTVRFSLGYSTTREEVLYAVDAIRKTLKGE